MNLLEPSTTLKPFCVSHLDARQELFLNAFPEQQGKSGASNEHYHWKFRHFPSSPPSYEYVAYNESKMVGYYAALPFPYKVGKKNRLAGMVCDVMTHSEARGQGIFTRLGRYSLEAMKEQNIDFVIGYPIRPEVIPGHLKVGWKVAFSLPIFVKVLKADSLMQAKKLGFLAPLANLGLAAYDHFLKTLLHPAERYSCQWLSPSHLEKLPEYASFYSSWSNQFANHLVKDKNFFSWRLSAPHTHYDILLGWRDGMLVSVTVLRKMTILDKVPILAIVDMMVLDGHEASLTSTMLALENKARQDNLEMIACMTTKYIAKKLRFFYHGFINSKIVFKTIINPLQMHTSFDDLIKEEDWHIMWIDADTV